MCVSYSTTGQHTSGKNHASNAIDLKVLGLCHTIADDFKLHHLKTIAIQNQYM